MEPENIFIDWSRRFMKLREKLFRREVLLFGFFFLLSFFLWFLNALGKDMTSRIVYPVRYVNLYDNRALVNELPDRITLTVNGPGYSILKNRLWANKPPLPIDLARVNYKVVRDDQRYEIYILTYGLREDLGRKLRDEFQILSVDPDTIYFEYERVASKRVVVEPVVEVTPMKQYMVYGAVKCIPDSIDITGPKTIVDTICTVYTVPGKATQVNSNTTISLALEPVKSITFSETKVEATIPVEQYTEAVREIDILLFNAPDSGIIRLFPDRVKVFCNVAMRDYNALLESPIEAVTDLKGVDIGTADKLRVTLRNVPPYATMVRQNPQEVEYIFEKLK